MLPNPLTPPQEDFTEAIDIGNGVSLVLESVGHTAHHNTFISTPTSNINMGVDSSDERSDVEERSDTHDDDDQDMSDGGAVLTLTLSHVEELNNEMDILDAEVMGAENLLGLFHSTPFPSTLVDSHPFLYSDSFPPPTTDNPQEIPGETMQGEYVQGAVDTSDLPTAMTEVSQQLQHLQDGQEHMEFQVAPEEQHTAFINNSITPFLFPFLPPQEYNSLEFTSEVQFVSMADISAANSTSVAPVSQNVPHLWGTEGWTPSSALDDIVPLQISQPESHLPQVNFAWEDGTEADQNEVEDQFNLSLGDFLYNWGTSTAQNEESKRRLKGPSLSELHTQRFVENLAPVRRSDLQGERCDIQRINWKQLGVSRFEAKQMRRQTYKNYTNLRFAPQWHVSVDLFVSTQIIDFNLQPRLHGAQLLDDQNFFRFRRMDFDHNVHLSHFQLRNLISCASRDHVFYAGKSKIIQWNPTSGTPGPKRVIMNLTDPTVQPLHALSGGIQISTLTVGHDILVAGGFCGEYGLVNLKAHKDTKHTEGIVTEHPNSITNHVQVHLSRTSLSPQVAFASNDNGVRILDVDTNKFIANHTYDHAINCSAISPDQRLRVLVGDTRQVIICNAQTGEILQNLEGHRDFGFACDWADDGWTVATGNQDMQIKIWDARKWTTSQGLACPVTTIAAEMAGARKLKFSPLGSGKRVLVAAEPADMVNVIDAETFSRKQTLSFFGEIGGFDFTNGGRDLLVANCDNMRGGLMEYERSDLASGSLYGVADGFESKVRNRNRRAGTGYDWMPTDEEICSHPSAQGTLESRKRKAAILGSSMGHF
jgi:WD40 repeat protein